MLRNMEYIGISLSPSLYYLLSKCFCTHYSLTFLCLWRAFLLPLVSLHHSILFLAYVPEGQHIALSKFHLRDYVTSDGRSTLISANKEGIVSLSGYLAIQLLGLSIGTLVLPPTPSFYGRRQAAYSKNLNTNKEGGLGVPPKRRNSNPKDKNFDISAPRQTAKTATELCAYAILWWALLGAGRMLKVDGWGTGEGGISRRMVRTSFECIMWLCIPDPFRFLLFFVRLTSRTFFGWRRSMRRSSCPTSSS
jgi:phosphatidylinositol glycan class W